MLNAETCAAVVCQLDPVSENVYVCFGQSYQQTAGKLVSLVWNKKNKVHLISYNQAKNSITTIKDFGEDY